LCGSIPVTAESVLGYSEKLAEARRKEAAKAMIWTAVEFENWRSTVSDPEKRKWAWSDLSNDQKHFSVSHMVPYPPLLTAFLAENGAAIKAALTASPFSQIWFYDEWSDKVLAVVERD